MKRTGFILLAVVMLVIIGGCGSPEQSVRMFLKYRISDDVDAAKLYCTDVVDERLENGEFTLFFLGFPDKTGGASTWSSMKGSLSLSKDSEETSMAVVSMSSSLGQVTYELSFEGGMWKIAEIKGIPTGAKSLDVGKAVEGALKSLPDEQKDAIEKAMKDMKEQPKAGK